MDPYALQLSHRLAAPPARVWPAWTTAQGLARWWWPTWSPSITVDLRIGGGYRIEASGQKIVIQGRYLIIEPITHLRMSWVWTDSGGVGPPEEVDVKFVPDAGGTIVRLEHSGPWDSAEPAENYRQGWTSVLDRFDTAG